MRLLGALAALVLSLGLGASFAACDDGGGDDGTDSSDSTDGDGDGAADAAPGAPDAPAAADAAPGAPDAAAESVCGVPGDVGNEMGVGKYCASIADCLGTPAPLCSSLGDPNTHFCTHTCANEDAGPAACGTGASCVCGNGGCGCTPDSCLD